MAGRVVLLVTSPRLPAGLLTAAAWDAVRAHQVFTAEPSAQVDALRAAGAAVTVGAPDATALIETAGRDGGVVWLAGPAGDEELARELGLRLAREPQVAELELLYGSWDPAGARLLDVVTVMDRLLSPGGDPWKRSQTHQTLAQFLLEEAYEAYDAIEAGDTDALREELGDVLLQVVLHARLAEELPDEQAWNVDDVAGGLVDKLIRRNPHVFAGVPVADVDEIVTNWERIKKAEKARDSALDGIALSQPALALAAKILSRAERSGLAVPLPDGGPPAVAVDEEQLGAAFLAAVATARSRGLDAEAALRRAALRHADALRREETRLRSSEAGQG